MKKESMILVMINPWSQPFKEELLKRHDEIGKRVYYAETKGIHLDEMARLYVNKIGEPFYRDLIRDHTELPATIVIYRGNQEDFTALKEELRKEYDNRIQPNPLYPQHQRNAIHSTRSPLEFLQNFKALRKQLSGTKRLS